MSLNKTVGVLAGAASAAFAGVALAETTPTDSDARIAALEQQIAELKAESGQWMNDEQVHAMVQEALADAETRTSLQREGAYGGYDDGFFLSNGDGSFRLNFGLTEQIRWIWNSREGDVGDGFDPDSFGFENTRTRLDFSGNAFGRETTYRIQGEFDSMGSFGLLDAWVGHQYDNGWMFRAGQMKAPFLHEELVSVQHQLAVERSLVNEMTTGGRTQGIEGSYDAETWRLHLMYSDGWGASGGLNGEYSNTPFNMLTTEFAVTGRWEMLLQGSDWDLFNDYTSFPNGDPGMLLGVAGHFQKGEFGTSTVDEAETFAWTVDLSAEFGGSNLAGYLVGQHSEPNDDALESMDQYGFVIQGGFFLNDQWEPFLRYEWMDLDMEGVDDVSLVTLGFNYYLYEHNLKWTTDLVWGLDSVPVHAAGLGLLADQSDEEDQLALRSQLQLAF